jgi:hypothetical protein
MPLSRSDQARLNGAKSHGPKTPQGKARSSLNALTHGRYATNAIILSNEDPAAFEDLIANYVRRIQPADQMEYHLTRELAAIDWRLTRIFALDTRLLDHEMDIQSPALDSAGLAVPELTRLLAASRAIVDRSQYPNFLARREAQLIRARQSILGVLRHLRKYFPPADLAPEVIPLQPLNPESPAPNEPGTNPTESGADPQCLADPQCGADPQVCAEPPGSAPKISVRLGAVSEEAPLDCTTRPSAVAHSANPGSAPDNSASGSISLKVAPIFTSAKAKSGADSEKAPSVRPEPGGSTQTRGSALPIDPDGNLPKAA